MAEGDRWETSAKCKVCGWYAARLLRSKALKGDCPYCGAYKSLEPV
tara:strand:+ start:4184 stop:4321 length:138 start_codon:yes stop_codon:yes gene_type:complete